MAEDTWLELRKRKNRSRRGQWGKFTRTYEQRFDEKPRLRWASTYLRKPRKVDPS